MRELESFPSVTFNISRSPFSGVICIGEKSCEDARARTDAGAGEDEILIGEGTHALWS